MAAEADGAGQAGDISITVLMLSGDELCSLKLPPNALVDRLLEAAKDACDRRCRLLLAEGFLKAGMTITDAGLTDGSEIRAVVDHLFVAETFDETACYGVAVTDSGRSAGLGTTTNRRWVVAVTEVLESMQGMHLRLGATSTASENNTDYFIGVMSDSTHSDMQHEDGVGFGRGGAGLCISSHSSFSGEIKTPGAVTWPFGSTHKFVPGDVVSVRLEDAGTEEMSLRFGHNGHWVDCPPESLSAARLLGPLRFVVYMYSGPCGDQKRSVSLVDDEA